jgi:hypothetical protein
LLAAAFAAVLALTAVPSALAATGQITGKVTDAATHNPVEGIEVCADLKGFEGEGACKVTSATGEYTLAELASGEYIVEFSVPFKSPLDYVTQYYNDAPSEAKATPVNVVSGGAPMTEINAAMEKGGQIAGHVTDASTGTGLEGALVCAFAPTPAEVGSCAATAAAGSYTISGLPTGQYQVVFFAKKYTPQFYNGKTKPSEADLVQVTAPNLTAGIDAALAPAVLPAPPSDLNPPAISGSATVGSALSCSNGLWAGNPAPTFTYAWLRDGAPIAGAAASAYGVQAADQGHTLSCRVTATNSAGTAAATSAGIAILTPPPPPKPPKLTILRSKLVVSKGVVRVRVRCAGSPCAGWLALERLVRPRRHPLLSVQVFGRGSVSLAANTTAVVTVKLNARGRARFARVAHHPRAAELACVVRGARPSHVRDIVE